MIDFLATEMNAQPNQLSGPTSDQDDNLLDAYSKTVTPCGCTTSNAVVHRKDQTKQAKSASGKTAVTRAMALAAIYHQQ